MPTYTYRGKTYTFEPRCIYCGAPTDSVIPVVTVSSRMIISETVDVPAHAECQKKRAAQALLGVLAVVLLVLLAAPVALMSLASGLWAAILALVCMVVLTPAGVLLVYRWMEAPRDQFMREHGLTGLKRPQGGQHRR